MISQRHSSMLKTKVLLPSLLTLLSVTTASASVFTIESSFMANIDSDAIAVHPTTGEFFVRQDSSSSAIDVYDASGTLLRSLATPGAAESFVDLDFGPDGLIVATHNNNDPTAFTIDPVTGAVLSSVSIPSQISSQLRGVSYNGFTDTLFVADGLAPDDTVQIAADGTLIDSFDLGGAQSVLASEGISFNLVSSGFDSSDLNGHLFYTSSFEGYDVLELTSDGDFVRVLDLSGIFDNNNCPFSTSAGGRGLVSFSILDAAAGEAAIGCGNNSQVFVVSGFDFGEAASEVPLPAAAWLFLAGVAAITRSARKSKG